MSDRELVDLAEKIDRLERKVDEIRHSLHTRRVGRPKRSAEDYKEAGRRLLLWLLENGSVYKGRVEKSLRAVKFAFIEMDYPASFFRDVLCDPRLRILPSIDGKGKVVAVSDEGERWLEENGYGPPRRGPVDRPRRRLVLKRGLDAAEATARMSDGEFYR